MPAAAAAAAATSPATSAAAALSPELARAARWLERHPHEAALCSMRECARRAGLSPATFTRLAKHWVHDGFDALKARLQQGLVSRAGAAGARATAERAQALQAAASRGPAWLEQLNQAQHANVASALGLNGARDLLAAADLLRRARSACFLGVRAAHGLAFHLAYTYGLIADNGMLIRGDGGTGLDQLARLGARDLLVAISQAPYASATVQAVRRATAAGVPVLALTDGGFPFLAGPPRLHLRFRADGASFFHSMVGALTLTEELVAAAAARGGAGALASLRARQRALAEQGAYWADPAPEPTPTLP